MPKPTRVDIRVHVRVSVEKERKPLRFGRGNAKLDNAIYTFSLPAGHTCPFARDCRSSSDRKTGVITDGPKTIFRCYASMMEARHPSVRKSRWHNHEQLTLCRTRGEMTRLILDSLSPFAGVVRVHDSGDFFSQDYFDAWLEVAQQRDGTVFYAYSKALPFWVKRLKVVGNGHEPGEVKNFVLTASRGGAKDRLIEEHNLRFAVVVYSPGQAEGLGLDIDHDDSHAMRHGDNFALLVHGQQPAGSPAAEAVRILRDEGWHGYGQQTRFPLRLFDNQGSRGQLDEQERPGGFS